MSDLTIRNPEVDQEVVDLVTKTFEMITPHWRAIIPKIEVVVTNKPFNRLSELREFCGEQNKQPDWKKSDWKWIQVVCPEFDDKQATLWVRSDRQGEGYYFQKEFFGVIAKLIWCTSEKLRQEVRGQATGIASESDGAAYMAFRDSFSRFFLNPDYLKERKFAAWSFMKRLDQRLRQ